jgi:hypothetical protein
VSQTVSCDTHGNRTAAFACVHVVATLKDRTPRGLFFDRDEDGCLNGWCADCEAMVAENAYVWAPDMLARADVKLLCEDCFRLAMKINNVTEGH